MVWAVEGPRLKQVGWSGGVKPQGSGVALEGVVVNMLRMLPSLTASSSLSTLSSKGLAGW
jgi:hypothetical protein